VKGVLAVLWAPRGFLGRTARLLSTAFHRFHEDGCLHLAASISYFMLLSFIPMLALFVSALALFVRSSEDFTARVFLGLETYFPVVPPTFVSQVRDLVRHAGTLGWVAGGFVLVTTELVFGSIQNALNRVFGSRKRGFIYSKVLSLALIGGAGAALTVSFGMAALAREGEAISGPQGLVDLSAMIARSFALRVALPVGLLAAVFTTAIKTIPNKRVHLRAAATGGIFCAALFEVTKHLFTWYVGSVAQYNVIYGSLGTLIVGLIWVHYSASLFLYSAELAAALDREIERSEGD
jgi:YihY family inner membrane protein